MRGEQKIVMYSCILSLQSQVHFDLLTYFGSSKKVSVFAFLFAETFLIAIYRLGQGDEVWTLRSCDFGKLESTFLKKV